MQCCARDSVSDGDIEEAAYFSKYAFAAYGYMLYIWSKPQFRWAPPHLMIRQNHFTH